MRWIYGMDYLCHMTLSYISHMISSSHFKMSFPFAKLHHIDKDEHLNQFYVIITRKDNEDN